MATILKTGEIIEIVCHKKKVSDNRWKKKKKKKKKILFISHIGRMGGTSYSLLLLIKFLKVQNYDFIVLIPEKGEFVNYLENEGIEYIVQPIRRRFIPKLMYFVKKNKIKLIYGNNFSNGSWIMLIMYLNS